MDNLEITVERAEGVKCERCWRYVPWYVPGLAICGRCRDTGMEDGWLVYDEIDNIFHRKDNLL